MSANKSKITRRARTDADSVYSNTSKSGSEFLHKIPRDLQKLLNAKTNTDVLANWNTLTALTKNEWICWVTIVKKEETRAKHLVQLCDDLRKGKRRPCCWPGCPHRRPSAEKWFGARNSTKVPSKK